MLTGSYRHILSEYIYECTYMYIYINIPTLLGKNHWAFVYIFETWHIYEWQLFSVNKNAMSRLWN